MYALQNYVREVMQARGLKKSAVVKALGYTSISGGCRRFDRFLEGTSLNQKIISGLPVALGVPEDEVQERLRETREEIRRHKEEVRRRKKEEARKRQAQERANFTPYLFCRTELSVPSPIFVCAFMGADRMRKLTLPPDYNHLPPSRQDKVRREAISSALHRFGGTIPSFGKILGFVLQRSYDDVASDREVYGLEGELIPLAPPEHREISKGRVSLTSRGHDITRFFRD